MPYAIHDLFVGGVRHGDFVSYCKTNHDVLADVVKYTLVMLDAPKAPRKELTEERHQADLYLDSSYVANILNDIDIKVLQVIDEATEKKIDLMLEFTDKSKKLLMEFNTTGNKEAEVRMSQIDFGVRRCLDRRFSRYYLEGTQEQRDQEDSLFEQYHRQASVFGFFLKSEYSDERFTQMLNSMAV